MNGIQGMKYFVHILKFIDLIMHITFNAPEDRDNPVIRAVHSLNTQYILDCVSHKEYLDNVSVDHMTALQLALRLGGRENNCTMLLHGGASMQFRDRSGSTALLIAAQLNTSLEDYCDPRVQVYRPACEGANPNAQDNSGMTALHYAVSHQNLDNCIYLLDHGADWEIVCSKYGTAIDIAQTLSKKGTRQQQCKISPILRQLNFQHQLRHDKMHLLEN